MSCKFFFACWTFEIGPLAQKSHSSFFSGTPFRFQTCWTSIVTMKYELYHNLGPLRSIWKALESKSRGVGRIYHPLCNVGLRAKLNSCWMCSIRHCKATLEPSLIWNVILKKRVKTREIRKKIKFLFWSRPLIIVHWLEYQIENWKEIVCYYISD